jgi:hypothetical protein
LGIAEPLRTVAAELVLVAVSLPESLGATAAAVASSLLAVVAVVAVVPAESSRAVVVVWMSEASFLRLEIDQKILRRSRRSIR